MQQSAISKRWLRRGSLGLLALAISILCGIGIASAATHGKRAQPAAAHPLGLVAPLSARHRHAAAHRAAPAHLRAHVKLVPRTLKAKLLASALQDPIVTVGAQPTGVAVSATRAYVANQASNTVSVIDLLPVGVDRPGRLFL